MVRNTRIKKFIAKSHSPKHVSPHTHSSLSFLSKNKVMTLGMISHTSPFVFSFFFSIYLFLIPTSTLYLYITELCTFARTQRNNNPSTRPLREQIQEYLRASKFSVVAKWKFPNSARVMLKLPILLPTLVPVQLL